MVGQPVLSSTRSVPNRGLLSQDPVHSSWTMSCLVKTFSSSTVVLPLHKSWKSTWISCIFQHRDLSFLESILQELNQKFDGVRRPFYHLKVVLLVRLVLPLHRGSTTSTWFYHFTVVLVFTNSCINPFIYAAKYREFQRGVKRLILVQSNRSSTTWCSYHHRQWSKIEWIGGDTVFPFPSSFPLSPSLLPTLSFPSLHLRSRSQIQIRCELPQIEFGSF